MSMFANIINDQYRYRYWYNTCMVQLIRVYFCICICVSSIESESSLAHLVLGSLCFNGHYITRQQFRRLKDLFHHQPRSTESSILLWWPIYYHKIWVLKRLSITISHLGRCNSLKNLQCGRGDIFGDNSSFSVKTQGQRGRQWNGGKNSTLYLFDLV